ncbi:CPBP family intramembrane glutamic endopeptidase [Ferdinandcohnia quinoae]|uniref:CPBP family intramembrane metalloprotease n=1 Tax=Fredinandcohnia quinoae TaxID=2918902 RepID=A0AAW5EE73_9BACI|nr:type II CAAX endopeptidase family protein [Fredinandcohnia sp. SECRCQ15]MCH1627453.1 CPBP family intramembrane metalloprotease [Fredinandcohnia sp. SECRCQ15]
MKARYWYVILTYVLMQLSGVLGFPLLMKLGVGDGLKATDAENLIIAYWTIISFVAALPIVLYLLRQDMKERRQNPKRSTKWEAFGWAIAGVFMAFAAQIIAANIEIHLFGIEAGSENTQNIMALVKSVPFLIIVVSVIGPILEEIVFRQIIFGALYKRFNFFIAGLLSSLVFAVVHMDFSHILLYTAMGFTFAFLYVHTKRIIVPICAHVAMNTFVVVMQTIFADDIERILKETENLRQTFIGGF